MAIGTGRRAARPGALWGLVFGATVAATMATYRSTFPTASSRANLVTSVQGNAAFEALFGPIHRIDTVAGYTAYKTMYTLVILGAVWGLLTATRVLRGEEEAGRWELYLSGPTTRGGAARQATAGLGVGLLALWVPTAVLTAATGAGLKVGIPVGASLFFATSMIGAAAMFAAVGVLASQLASTRRGANLIGAGVLAASYLIRMAADSSRGLGWLRWASPLGWIEELRPLTGSRPLPFALVIGLITALLVVASGAAQDRDLGSSIVPSHDRSRPRTLLLGSQAGLTARLARPTVVAWLGALTGTGLAFGLVTEAAGRSLRTSPTIDRVIARLGATKAGAVVYLGFVFLIAAGLVAVAVAGQVAALRREESAGHLDNLLVRTVPRWQWLAARMGVGAGLVLAASVLTGLAAWVGASSQHAAVGLSRLLEAGLNVAPPALFVLGIGVLAYGLWPRAAIGVTYGLVVWSFLVETIASAFNSNHWLRDTSPLAHIAPAPAADPNWGAALWLVGLAILAGAAGVAAFGRRDLQGA